MKINKRQMIAGNSFQQLMAKNEEDFKRRCETKVQSNISGTLGLFRFAGGIVNVFVPSIVDVMILGLGGRQKTAAEKQTATSPSNAGDAMPGKKGPGDPSSKTDKCA